MSAGNHNEPAATTDLKDRFAFRTCREMTYARTPQGDLNASIYFPFDLNEGDQRPGILFFFGGGFRAGSRHQFVRQASYLASRGMVAATVDYRVSSYHGTGAVQCFEDAFAALHWFRTSSDEFGIDPERIAAGGGSAGGTLAFGTSVLQGFADPAVHPNALVLFNPALGLRRIANGEDGTPADELPEKRPSLGLTEETLARISMEDQISKALPPAYAWFGTADRFLPPAQKVLETAQSYGSRVDLELADGADHGYFNFPHPFFASSLHAADTFLQSIGYLEGPPGI